VDGGERAVIFDRFRGVLPEVVSEGTHLRVPWVQTPHIMDIRTRPRTISSVTGTKGEAARRGRGGGRHAALRRMRPPRGDTSAADCAELRDAAGAPRGGAGSAPRALRPRGRLRSIPPPPYARRAPRPADLQMVNMSLRLLSKPSEDKLPQIFKVRLLQWGAGGRRGQPAAAPHAAAAAAAAVRRARLRCRARRRLNPPHRTPPPRAWEWTGTSACCRPSATRW
jgi:hypothetical protein